MDLVAASCDGPGQVVERIYDEVMSFTRCQLSDDMAVLALHVSPPAGTA